MNLSEMLTGGELKKVLKKEKFMEEFGDVDRELEDDFKLGISLMNKSLRLYSPFNNSDLIIASPLGLRLAIETI